MLSNSIRVIIGLNKENLLRFSKVLLKLAATTDPAGALMLFDYNCLSAAQYEYFVYFASTFGK
jgi:hypothetical protein